MFGSILFGRPCAPWVSLWCCLHFGPGLLSLGASVTGLAARCCPFSFLCLIIVGFSLLVFNAAVIVASLVREKKKAGPIAGGLSIWTGHRQGLARDLSIQTMYIEIDILGSCLFGQTN